LSVAVTSISPDCARWISFFTFCSGHPIAEAISPYPSP